jgi:hypothetical protein
MTVKSQPLSDAAFAALADSLPASALWSQLLSLMERRARGRSPAELLRQWEQDEFTAPAPLDQRLLLPLDARLLEAAAAFEAIELSPLTPLGTCSAVALASQNKIVSALRGTEVVSDPTNVLALECARRLRRSPEETPRLATRQRVVRAQRLPPRAQRTGFARHFAQHFRIFVLGAAGREVQDHGRLVPALAEQIRVHVRALDLLEQDGYRFPGRVLRLLATPQRAAIMDRVAAEVADLSAGGGLEVRREGLEHPYYSGGLRFLINVRAEGVDVPLIDGGSFDWVARLSANRRLYFVASGMGAQLAAALFRDASGDAPGPGRGAAV